MAFVTPRSLSCEFTSCTVIAIMELFSSWPSLILYYVHNPICSFYRTFLSSRCKFLLRGRSHHSETKSWCSFNAVPCDDSFLCFLHSWTSRGMKLLVSACGAFVADPSTGVLLSVAASQCRLNQGWSISLVLQSSLRYEDGLEWLDDASDLKLGHKHL